MQMNLLSLLLPLAVAGCYSPPNSCACGGDTGIACSQNQTQNYQTDVPVIPNGTEAICADAFKYCSGLDGVLIIPESVTSIGANAFEGCIGLNGTFTLPDSVTSIGDGAFMGCSGLIGDLIIPDGVTSIGDRAFYGCRGLTNLTIPSVVWPVLETKTGVFELCSGLTDLIIPDGVTSTGESTFYDCTGLKDVTFPDSLTSIGSSAFYGCTGLTTLTFPDGLISIGRMAFLGSGLHGDLTFPNTVTSIGAAAFAICTGLNGTVTIPDGVTSIEAAVFYGCTGLKDVIIPEGVTSIGEGASIGEGVFQDCTGLIGTLTIPASVNSIGNTAFKGCTGLCIDEDYLIQRNITIGTDAFLNTKDTCTFATCSDSIQNRHETGVDCGGFCPDACAPSPGGSTSDAPGGGDGSPTAAPDDTIGPAIHDSSSGNIVPGLVLFLTLAAAFNVSL